MSFFYMVLVTYTILALLSPQKKKKQITHQTKVQTLSQLTNRFHLSRSLICYNQANISIPLFNSI